MTRHFLAAGAAFVASSLLYRPTHRNDFPELGRYTAGGLLLLAAWRILHPADDAGLRRLFTVLSLTGLGVGLARLWPLLTSDG